MESKAICYVDNHHGIYIPQIFAERALAQFDCYGIKTKLKYLLKGPKQEFYFETMAEIENFPFKINGTTYFALYGPCGDLFLVPEDEIENWFE